MATVDPIKVEIEILHEWQLCPKCGGKGELYASTYDMYSVSTIAHQCDLCNGKKIISKINGQPPQ